MTIKEPFGPWKTHDVYAQMIRRASGRHVLWIPLNEGNEVRYSSDGGSYHTMLQPGSSLVDAVTYVDKYIADNFEVERTTEQKLADALAEVERLKQELSVAIRKGSHESANPKFKVGQVVRLTKYKTGAITKIDRLLTYGGVIHFSCVVDGREGYYMASELEPA